MSAAVGIPLTLFLLLCNAFFVGAEFALVSARRAAIEPRAEAGSARARTTIRAMERISLMLAGAQLGITICSVALGSVSEPVVAHLLEPVFHAVGLPESALHPLSFAVALAVITFLHVVLGEMIPKNIALAGPDAAALVLAPPLSFVVRMLRPVIGALNWSANHALRLAGVEPKDEVTSAFTRDEVAGLVEQSHREGVLPDESHDLLAGALSFEERTVRSVVLPLARLRSVRLRDTPEDVERAATDSGYSRFPVVHDDGSMAGYVHLKDVLVADAAARTAPLPRRSIRRLPVVRVSDPLRTVLALLQRERAHLGRVVDAEGRTVGLVALEDVLEELVGRIRDDAARR